MVLIVFLCPPIGLLLCGKIFSAIANFIYIVCCCVMGVFIPPFWLLLIAAPIHGLYAYSSSKADDRNNQLIRAIRGEDEPTRAEKVKSGASNVFDGALVTITILAVLIVVGAASQSRNTPAKVIATDAPAPEPPKVEVQETFPTAIREWTNAQGSKTTGRVLSKSPDGLTVAFEREDKQVFPEFPVSNLAPEDQELVARHSNPAP